MAELLLEIGLEEIPARMIAAAEAQLAARVVALLEREYLLPAPGGAGGAGPVEVRSYSSPRRLAVQVGGVREAQPDREEALTGPAWSVAFRDGVPGPAAQAFAKKAGVAVEALTRVATAKGEYAGAIARRPGRTAVDVLAAELPKELGALDWPKNMYWRPGKPERYVRPVKWLLTLLDDQVLAIEFAGVRAGAVSYGHRILYGNEPIPVAHPRDYLPAIEQGKVMADVSRRRHTIRKALDYATRAVTNARWREDEALIETVVHLTEWPSVVLGGFGAEFLVLPEEVLVTVMRDHQKYFAVEDAAGRLAPYFLAVLNTEADAAGMAVIRHGNERVLRARFNDARFFWDFDQKISLSERVELLKAVTFQKDLGNYHQKTEGTRAIALQLAAIAGERGIRVDQDALLTAALFAKTDLTSELVKEFTELQGVVGGLYARAQGLGEAVAQAIYWQYRPASGADSIPPSVEGQILGLAERIGTVADMFALGLEPTGSKDPYALRRSANAIVRILAESNLLLGLSDLLRAAGAEEGGALGAFFGERIEFYLRDVQGVAFDVVSAVRAAGTDDIADAVARAQALNQVRGSDDFASIAAAFKRSKNILKQAGEKQIDVSANVEAARLVNPAERALYQAAQLLGPQVERLRGKRDYSAALERVATLRPHVDLFFQEVMVMVEDGYVRGNRLALLAMIVAEFSRIADFSEIVSAGEA